MSRKKKLSPVQKTRARMARQASAEPAVPVEAVEAYYEVFTWAAENPEAAAELLSFDEQHWAGIMAGVAFPERFGITEDQLHMPVWQLRAWAIMSGFKYIFEWPTPIATMSDDDIIDAIRQSAAEGKIALKD